MTENTESRERAILVGVNCGTLPNFDHSDEETMEELKQLLDTAGGELVFTTMQNRRSPDPHTFIGEGKADEIKDMVKDNDVSLVVFDNDISPSQTKALEKQLDCRVIDRSTLILDIFADRAKTREGKLQVELAQYQYLLPRLSGMWGHLVRQTAAGGKSPIGTRGPGETQLETDRRHIRRKIEKLQEEIELVKRVRTTQRGMREKSGIPLVCIVGYTNSGKSTLLNSLTGAEVQTGNRLFDTLDPTTKMMENQDKTKLLISDTVGFIRKLPHHLIDSFRSTLEELTFADLLLHVIDASNPNWREQAQVVESLIAELGAQNTPRITVFNKVDLLNEDQLPRQVDAYYCSALKGIGLDAIIGKIDQMLRENAVRALLLLPYGNGGLLDLLYREAKVLQLDYVPEGILVQALCPMRIYNKLQPYAKNERGTDG